MPRGLSKRLWVPCFYGAKSWAHTCLGLSGSQALRFLGPRRDARSENNFPRVFANECLGFPFFEDSRRGRTIRRPFATSNNPPRTRRQTQMTVCVALLSRRVSPSPVRVLHYLFASPHSLAFGAGNSSGAILAGMPFFTSWLARFSPI